MKNLLGRMVILMVGMAFTCPVWAQDTSRRQHLPPNVKDSIRQQPDSMQQKSDTARMRRGRLLAALFADSAKLTTNDYQLQIEKTYLILNNVVNKSELGLPVKMI